MKRLMLLVLLGVVLPAIPATQFILTQSVVPITTEDDAHILRETSTQRLLTEDNVTLITEDNIKLRTETP